MFKCNCARETAGARYWLQQYIISSYIHIWSELPYWSDIQQGIIYLLRTQGIVYLVHTHGIIYLVPTQNFAIN